MLYSIKGVNVYKFAMFFTNGSQYLRHEVIPVWNGKQYDIRDVLMLTTEITTEVYHTLPPEHPRYNNTALHVGTSWGIGALYDPA